MNEIEILKIVFGPQINDGRPPGTAHADYTQIKATLKVKGEQKKGGLVKISSNRPTIKELEKALKMTCKCMVNAYRKIVGIKCLKCESWFDKNNLSAAGLCDLCEDMKVQEKLDREEAARIQKLFEKHGDGGEGT